MFLNAAYLEPLHIDLKLQPVSSKPSNLRMNNIYMRSISHLFRYELVSYEPVGMLGLKLPRRTTDTELIAGSISIDRLPSISRRNL